MNKANNIAIDLRNLTKIFTGKTVVDHISLKVKRGAIFGFLGSNGSGKTTTIRMICGLLTPSDGSGSCLGYNIKTERAKIKTKIGYIPQKFSLYKGLTVRENLQFFADLYEINNASQAIDKTLADLALSPYEHIKTGDLSGGWQQRLSLASSLLHNPELLFLDEPTAGIDPKARKDFWDYLHKIAMRDNTTVLVATHYMDEAEKCTDLAYINLGHLLYAGPTNNLISFSKVKTYLFSGNRNAINSFINIITRFYPKLLSSIVNNNLRISSHHQASLMQFINEQHNYSFIEVTPSFEEVFIGLME